MWDRMTRLDVLNEVVEESRAVRLVETDIYSVLPDPYRRYQYDRRAAVYDFVVGTSLYNRMIWGARARNYESFARTAVDSDSDGLILDAGCGSLLFTAGAYAQSHRPIIACDQSLDMLRRARARLLKFGTSVDQSVILLQADLADIPFRDSRFRTVVSMNVIHHYADVANLIRNLNAISDGGRIYLTSLIMNDRYIGDWYLRLLHEMGWLVRPRTQDELKKLLEQALNTTIQFWTEGNMAYATTGQTVSTETQ
jgi:SAM-dependent methyltransferase